MNCQIEVMFSPARPDLADHGLHDPGGFVYRIRNEAGAVTVSGSVHTLDPLKALARAQQVARDKGYTEWRAWSAGGPYHALTA